MDHLTADQVAKKRFTPVRLREGYDMGEVDQFLDEVESALRVVDEDVVKRKVYKELHEDFQNTLETRAQAKASEQVGALEETFGREREDLLSQLAALESSNRSMKSELSKTKVDLERTGAELSQARHELEEFREGNEVVTVEAPVEVVAEPEVEEVSDAPNFGGVFQVETVADASAAARRLLEIATGAHDEMLEEARAEAQRVIGEGEAQLKQLEDEATARLAELEETESTRSREFAEQFEKDRQEAESKLDELRGLEAELRTHLRTYLSDKLGQLDEEEKK